MRTAVLDFKHPSEFQEIYLRDFPNGGLFIETEGDFFLGERLRVLSCFPEIPEGVAVHGTVIWRRAPSKRVSKLKPGVGVGVDETDKNQLSFLLDYSSGGKKTLRRQTRRVPTDFRVDFACSQEWHVGKALNISRDGIFILTHEKVSLNAALQMKLYLDGSGAPEPCSGRVAWRCDREPENGFGVEFQFTTDIRRSKIMQYVCRGESMLMKRFPSASHIKIRPVTTTS